MCVKDVKIYFIGLKNNLFGCFRIEEIRDKDNETGLKVGGGIEMSIYSAFHIRDARSLRFCIYLPAFSNKVEQTLLANVFPLIVSIGTPAHNTSLAVECAV